MAHPEKVAEVQAIAERIAAAQSIVLADYSGLTVEQMTKFRVQCRANNIDCRVVKNRLAKIACDNTDTQFLKDVLTGPTAFVFGPESQIEPAKIVVNFAKENEAMGIKGGMVDGEFLDPSQVMALSRIPSRDELYAKMMGSINSPLTGIAGAMNAVTTGLARTINAVAEEQAKAAS